MTSATDFNNLGARRGNMTINFYEQVYAVVRRIPRGKVTSYGRIAAMLGQPQAARAVGYALNALRDKKDDPAYQNIPWQRVVNSQGRISIVNQEYNVNVQAKLLREEGVVVSEELKIDLDIYLWEGLHLVEIDDIQSGSRLVQ
jgi:methylated-DNA-protein-cysteine methyltransferase-like protein